MTKLVARNQYQDIGREQLFEERRRLVAQYQKTVSQQVERQPFIPAVYRAVVAEIAHNLRRVNYAIQMDVCLIDVSSSAQKIYQEAMDFLPEVALADDEIPF